MENERLAEALSVTTENLVRWLREAPVAEPLSPSAASLLFRLDSAGPQRIADLTKSLNVSQPAVTQLVSRLETEGLIRREASKSDGRSFVIHLTHAGAVALDERRTRRADRLAIHLATLDPEQREHIAHALPALDALIATSTHPSTQEESL